MNPVPPRLLLRFSPLSCYHQGWEKEGRKRKSKRKNKRKKKRKRKRKRRKMRKMLHGDQTVDIGVEF